MRKHYCAVNVHAAAGAGAPHRAREIAESVSGKQRGPFKGRNEKAAREMRMVMLDAMKLCLDLLGIGIKGRGQGLRNTRELREHFDTFPRERGHAQSVKKFRAQPRVRISRHGDMIDVRECEPCFLQAVTNGLRRESRGVLHPVKAFYLYSRYKQTVADNPRRS